MKKPSVTAGGLAWTPGGGWWLWEDGKGTGCRGNQGLALGCVELEELPTSWVNTRVHCVFRARNLNVKVTIQYRRYTIFKVDRVRPTARGLRTELWSSIQHEKIELKAGAEERTKRTASETERNAVPVTFQTFHKNS